MSDESGRGQKRRQGNGVTLDDVENVRHRPKINIVKAPPKKIVDEGESTSPAPSLTPPDAQALNVAPADQAAASAAAAGGALAAAAVVPEAAAVVEDQAAASAAVAGEAPAAAAAAAAAAAPPAESAPVVPAAAAYVANAAAPVANAAPAPAAAAAAVAAAAAPPVVLDSPAAPAAPSALAPVVVHPPAAPAPAPAAAAAPAQAGSPAAAQATGASKWGSLKANEIMEDFHALPPTYWATFSSMFPREAYCLEQEAHAEVARLLNELQNSPTERTSECRNQLAEEDEFVYDAVVSLYKLQRARRANVEMCLEEFLAEARAWRSKDPRRQSPLSKARAKAEKSCWTHGPPEWYVRAKEWSRARSTPPHGMGSASRPAPAGSREQAAGGTAPSAESCGQAAARTPAPAELHDSRGISVGVCGQAAEPTDPLARLGFWAARRGLAPTAETTGGRGTKRGAGGVVKNEAYEAYLAEQQKLVDKKNEDILQKSKRIRKMWDGPEGPAYGQVAEDLMRQGASNLDVVEAKASADENIREWERQEFVAAYGGRGSATAWPVIGETVDGGTAGAASDDLGGCAAAAAGGGATGMGVAAGGAQEDASSGEAADDSPAQVHTPPPAVGLGKRKRRAEVDDSKELEEPGG